MAVLNTEALTFLLKTNYAGSSNSAGIWDTIKLLTFCLEYVATGTTVTGTLKLQASNALPSGKAGAGPIQGPPAADDPSWVDVPDSTATVTLSVAGGGFLRWGLPSLYRWTRVVWTKSGTPSDNATVTVYPYGFGGGV